MRTLLSIIGLLALLVPIVASAQTDEALRLIPGVDITGTLDTSNFAQTYIFEGSAGDAITLDAFTESEDLSLVLLVTGVVWS